MFDTCAAARTLRDAGFDESQAEAAVAMVRDAISEGAATKEDVARLESKIDAGIARLEGKIDSDIAGVKAEIADMRAEIGGMKAEIGGIKAEIGGVKAEVGGIKAEIGGIKADMGGIKADMGGLETRLTVRMYGGLGAVVVVLLAFLKLMP